MNPLIKNLSSLFLLSTSFLGYSQSCPSTSRQPYEWPGHNNWYYGNGGIINFDAGTVTDGAGKDSYEGVSAASDDAGNLLFYTNGRLLWNAAGVETYNGLLTGNENGSTTTKGSASQGVITVKHPLDPDSYYILTVDDALSGTAGLNYFEVDPAGNEVGGGATRLGAFRTTEAISATLHDNGVDIWVTVAESGSENYHSFLLTCDGWNPVPVTSGGGVNVNTTRERGGSAFSWDGTKFLFGHPDWFPNGEKELILYDFNKATGALTNPQAFGAAATAESPYDVTFSPDGNRVYWSVGGNGQLWTADISSGVAATIRGTIQNTGISLGSFASLELGADGNLYMSSSGQRLRRITGDINGGAGLVKSAQIGTGNLGLSTLFIPPTEEPDIEEVGPYCDTDGPVDLNTVWLCAGVDAEEPGRGEYTGTGITDVDNGIFDPSVAGEGLHEIIFTFCEVDDTIWIQVDKCTDCTVDVDDVNPAICVGETFELDPLVLAVSGVAVWSIDVEPGAPSNAAINVGATTEFDASNLATVAGDYTLKLTNTDGAQVCEDNFIITVNPLPVVDLGDDQYICPGDPAVDFDAGVFTSFLWSGDAAGADQVYNTDAEGTFIVEVTDANGCKATDEAQLIYHDLPVVDLGDDQYICPGDPAVDFDAGVFAAYVWSGDAAGVDQVFTTDAEGVFDVEVTDANGCKATDQVELIHYDLPVVDLGLDQTICPGDPAVDFDAGVFAAYVWSVDAAGADQVYSSADVGVFEVEVTDANGCKATDQVELFHHALPVVDLGPDQIICPGDPAVDFDAGVFTAYAWSGDAAGVDQVYNTDAVGTFIVEVTDVNGCKATDEARLLHHDLLVVDLGDDQYICPGDPAVNFDAGVFAAYTWGGDAAGVDQVFASAAQGVFEVEVTDANGCKATDQVELIHYALPVVDLGPDQAICPGDPAVDFDAGVFTAYVWSIDAAGADQVYSTGDVGVFEVEVTDANGCKASDQVELTHHVLPVVDLGPDQLICEGEPAVAFDAGAFAAYRWFGDAAGADQIYNSDVAGIFSVEVTDANGCLGTDEVELTVVASPTPTLPVQVVCPGMDYDFNVGVYDDGAHTYLWNTGELTPEINVSVAGPVWVEVTDVNGCMGRADGELIHDGDLDVIIDGAPEIQLCEGEVAELKTNYAAADGYFFTWAGLGVGNTETIMTGALSGTYEVRVDNGMGCEGSTEIDVVINPLPLPVPVDAEFCESSSVNIGLGMGAAYSYLWSTGETTEEIEVNSVNYASPYNVTVTNIATGCSEDAVINVDMNLDPIVNVEDQAECEGTAIELRSDNAYVGATYSWTGGANTESINPDAEGIYRLTVTSAEGCIGFDEAEVIFYEIPIVDLGDDQTICEGESYTFDVGNQLGDILWNTGVTSQEVTGTTSQVFNVEVSYNGCSANDEVVLTVVENPESQLDQSLTNQKYCFEEMERGLTITANASDDYEYLWSTGENAKTITVEEEGTYLVRISIGDCFVEDNIRIEEYCPWSLFVPNAFTPDGDGNNDTFNAKADNVIEYQMLIYNRWGDMIYESNSIDNDWDGTFMGKEAQIDVYVYKIYYSYEDESGVVNEEQQVGRVSLIR